MALLAGRTGKTGLSLAVSLDLSGVRAEAASSTVIPFLKGHSARVCQSAYLIIPFSRSLVYQLPLTTATAPATCRAHTSSVPFSRDVWENWWIRQGTPRPAEIHRGHLLGPEIGLKWKSPGKRRWVRPSWPQAVFDPNEQRYMGTSRDTLVYLRRCPARLVKRSLLAKTGQTHTHQTDKVPGSFGWIPPGCPVMSGVVVFGNWD